MDHREQKTEELLRKLAAEFLMRESNRQSLITVTNVKLGDRFSHATIFITVLPEDKEAEALDFVKRKRTEFREFITKHSKLQRIPYVDFEIDFGEKNRQRIEEISAT